MIIYPKGIEVDEATKKRTERFFALVDEIFKQGECPPAEEPEELIALVPGICLEAWDGWVANTPLSGAVGVGLTQTVAALIKAGANIEAQTYDGFHPLYFAAGDGFAPIVEALIKAGANIEVRDPEPPLIRAAKGNRTMALKALLSKGANIHVHDSIGNTLANCSSRVLESLDSIGFVIPDQQQKYETFITKRTAPKSAEEVYHLLAVTPLIDPKAPVDRDAHLRQIFLHAEWKDKARSRTIIDQLRKDGTISCALGESLLALTQPARISALAGHGRGR